MKTLLLLLITLAFGINIHAAEPPPVTLKVGDPAPKLEVSSWLQGGPIASFDKDKAYIVEFWATWCGPCRTTIPHLNKLHQKYKDKGLVVIGQDAFERDQKAPAEFVKKMGDQMTYPVALDKMEGKEGVMARTWMKAAGQNGIPCAFVVDKQGKVAWIGHPMKLTDDIIEKVLAGTYSPKKTS